MKKNSLFNLIFAAVIVMTSACSKSDDPTISKPLTKVGQSVAPGDVSGTIKGTMMSDQTYTLNGRVVGSATFQCEMTTFNNTFVNGGWRRVDAGRGGSINYEEGAKGLIYNNLIVNCRYGARMVGNPAADVADSKLGSNYNYGETLDICNQFYPTGHITPPQTTDIPNPSSFLPAGYQPGDVYDGSSLVLQNDPQFVNYPVGNTFNNILVLSYAGSFDFRLKSTSPALGKGTTNFQPYFVSDANFPKGEFGSTEITLPSSDIGAFPANGKGNQHY